MLTPDSLITNQSQETPPADHISHKPHSLTLSLKAFPWKPLGNSDPSSTTYLDSLLGNEHRIFLHHNPMSIDRLYYAWASWHRPRSVTYRDQSEKLSDHLNWWRKKEFMILSSYLWFRKKQNGNKEFFIIIIKCIYEKTSINIIFDGQMLWAVHLKWETK